MARMLKFTSAVALVLAALAGVAAANTHHLCLQYGFSGAGSVFYEITADDTQTKVDRYDMSKNPPQLVDSNTFGALSVPNPPNGAWDAGVAFANELRSRGAWTNNNEAVTGAHWEVISDSEDKWRFETTLFGQPFELTFSTATCAVFPTAAPTPAQETAAPVVPEPPATTPVTPPPQPSVPPTVPATVPAVPATVPASEAPGAGPSGEPNVPPTVPATVPASNAPGSSPSGQPNVPPTVPATVPATPGSQPTQPGDNEPIAPVTTSVISGNVGGSTEVAAAFSGSSAWMMAAASVATACAAVLV